MLKLKAYLESTGMDSMPQFKHMPLERPKDKEFTDTLNVDDVMERYKVLIGRSN